MNLQQPDHPSAGEIAAEVDLKGQVAVVTGASAGLGVETARALAAAGAEVVLAARSRERTEAAMAAIRAVQPDARLAFQPLDLADLDSVRRAAEALAERYPVLHRVVANAGVMACPLQRTREGCELQFGVNHLGHFLLVNRLAPQLVAGAPARVVVLSSAGHRASPVDFDDPHFQRRPYDKWVAYGQAKTANALYALELNRRLQSQGVTAFAVHPGAIVTELGRHMDEADFQYIQSQSPVGGMAFKPLEYGAATSVWAATAAELEGRGGLYLHDCRIGEATEDDAAGPEAGYRPWAMDAEAASRLWTLSEALTGEDFPLTAASLSVSRRGKASTR